MFEQAMLSHGPATSRIWTTGAGMAGEAVLVAAATLVSLLVPQVVPEVPLFVPLVAPGMPRTPAAEVQAQTPQPVTGRKVFDYRQGLQAPSVVPSRTHLLPDEPEIVYLGASGGPAGIAGGVGVGGADSILGSILAAVAPPGPPVPIAAPVAAPKPAAPARYKAGGLVKPARLVSSVEPVYPPIAVSMRVAGVVTLQGVIGTDGRVRELHATGGHPLLVRAALDAVSKWVYEPTLLNGEPVEVQMPITVTFRLK